MMASRYQMFCILQINAIHGRMESSRRAGRPPGRGRQASREGRAPAEMSQSEMRSRQTACPHGLRGGDSVAQSALAELDRNNRHQRIQTGADEWKKRGRL